MFHCTHAGQLDDLMESKAGKKSGSKSLFYEAPLGYGIEDVRPSGGLRKFKSAAFSNVSFSFHHPHSIPFHRYNLQSNRFNTFPFSILQCTRKPS